MDLTCFSFLTVVATMLTRENLCAKRCRILSNNSEHKLQKIIDICFILVPFLSAPVRHTELEEQVSQRCHKLLRKLGRAMRLGWAGRPGAQRPGGCCETDLLLVVNVRMHSF